MKILNLTCAVAGIGTLAACGGGVSSNPGAFTYTQRDGVLAGEFDPAGFNSDEVQNLIASDCKDRKLATYSEEPGRNGRIAFSATCE